MQPAREFVRQDVVDQPMPRQAGKAGEGLGADADAVMRLALRTMPGMPVVKRRFIDDFEFRR